LRLGRFSLSTGAGFDGWAQKTVEPLERQYLGLSAAGFHRNIYWEWPSAQPDAPRLIAMHGLTRNGRDFDAVARAASDRFHVVCPDVVGRGKSGWLPDGALYSYPQYLGDAVALIARIAAGPVDWLGTSMGGLVGMMLAAQPLTPIRRLILNDVGPFVPKASLERIGAYVGEDPRFADMAELEAYLRRVYADFGDLSDADWAHMARHSARSRPDGGYGPAYDPAIADAFRAGPIADVDLWPIWERIRCPVLILRGARSDLLLPKTAARMAASRPNVCLVEFPDCGHAPALMNGEQVGAIRDWLERTAP
jgi:pimeloyl-ACP methyl ester carboxylesterase